jgi:hypothetical protein
MRLTNEQESLLQYPIQSKTFLQGNAGSGKTTAGVNWLKKLIRAGHPAHEIMIFVPQRELALPYQQGLWEMGELTHSIVDVLTLGGLSRRMVDLYWPMIGEVSGFSNPYQPPHFLTLETAQYYMAHIVRPLIEKEGFFSSLTVNRNRIYSQILDNLNKAAIIGFSYQEIAERLKSAWVGDVEQFHIYDDVQACVNLFRAYCFENNLLDFSLQVELFINHLWSTSFCHEYLTKKYRHLIVDNIEEDTPVSHDILREWLPDFDSVLLIYDEGGGFRSFLGADPHSALSLKTLCENSIEFKVDLLSNSGITDFKSGIHNAIKRLEGQKGQISESNKANILSALVIPTKAPKYFPAMIEWVGENVKALIEDGTSPGEIVILAPFMPDVLRFALSNQLDLLNIPNHSHRPSRPLRDQPATQTMLTLASLAFRLWEMPPKRINLAFALMQALDGLDLVRAQLLTQYIYQHNGTDFVLKAFETAPPDIRRRISYIVGERYDHLRKWLETYSLQEEIPLDFFINRLFGEVLSQPGFGFHDDLDSANTIANLVESIQKFRLAVGTPLSAYALQIGKEYIQMVQDGVIAAQYPFSRQNEIQNSIFLAPAYTFLMKNQPVDVQFWLDISSPSWYQRLDQPLTQPYVLSRHWEMGEVWTAENEIRVANQVLERLTIGLLNRCRKKLYLGMSELDVRGFENRGLLVRIFQSVLQNQTGRGT